MVVVVEVVASPAAAETAKNEKTDDRRWFPIRHPWLGIEASCSFQFEFTSMDPCFARCILQYIYIYSQNNR